MEHRRLRVTKEQFKRISAVKKLKTITQVAEEHYKDAPWFKYQRVTKVDEYYVPFELVRTEDLIDMMRCLTIFDGFISYLKFPTAKQLDRMTYLDMLEEYTDMEFTESEFSTIQQLVRNRDFMERKYEIYKLLKQELSTREHVPNKKDKKIIRKLKSQGKYIID